MNRRSWILLALALLVGMAFGCVCSWCYSKYVNRPERYESPLFGIDVSHHQGKIDWDKVPDSVQFVYVKCTEGKTYSDPMYRYNVWQARRHGFEVGSYHFFRMTSGAQDQFSHFLSRIDTANQTLVPMVDVEVNDGADYCVLQDSLYVFVKLVEDHFGVKPMIYCPQRLYARYFGPDKASMAFWGGYPMYLARYRPGAPIMRGVHQYTIWQYSERGKVEGIEKHVDKARFHPDCDISMIKIDKKR